MTYKNKQILSILLGILSSAGTVATAILVAKETPKAMDKIKKIKDKGNIRKIDYIKELIPIYWPAALTCIGTISSTTIGSIISMKAQASLLAASTVLSQGWRKYKNKILDLYGPEGAKKITNLISSDEYEQHKKELINNDNLFWEENIGFFKCKKEDLMGAINDINQRLHTPDPNPNGTFYMTTLYFFLKDAHAFVFDKNKLEASKSIGWTLDYICDVYQLNCMWVHPLFTKVIKLETGEVLYTKLSFFEDPIFLEEAELSRSHYKSREDFEHEAEIDMHDADAFAFYSHGYQDIDPLEIERELVNSKIDCDRVNDNGRRFISTNQIPSVEYIENNSELPGEKDIPSTEALK